MTKYTMSISQAEELNKFPHLKSYVEEYIKNNGLPDQPGYISSLVYFFKRKCLDNNLSEEALFGWDEETAEDFYSWGSNSRWANTFDSCLSTHFSEYLDTAIMLAKAYGYNDIYEERN